MTLQDSDQFSPESLFHQTLLYIKNIKDCLAYNDKQIKIIFSKKKENFKHISPFRFLVPAIGLIKDKLDYCCTGTQANIKRKIYKIHFHPKCYFQAKLTKQQKTSSTL